MERDHPAIHRAKERLTEMSFTLEDGQTRTFEELTFEERLDLNDKEFRKWIGEFHKRWVEKSKENWEEFKKNPRKRSNISTGWIY